MKLEAILRIVGVDLVVPVVGQPRDWVLVVERGVTDIAGNCTNWCGDRYRLPVSENEARGLGSMVGRSIRLAVTTDPEPVRG